MFYTKIKEAVKGKVMDWVKAMEAALAMNTSHDALRNQLRGALKTAHGLTPESWSNDGPFLVSTFPSNVVYEYKNQMYRRPYTLKQGESGAEPTITLGDPKPVHAAFVDSKTPESARSLHLTPLDEAYEWTEAELTEYVKASVMITPDPAVTMVYEAVDFDPSLKLSKESALPSTIPVKLIAPGWGSKAYYSKEVLKRDGPSVFKKGMQMFWNHATESQEAERPEGDLRDLAAVTTEAAHWEDNGVKGPGLYAKAKVFSDYATQVAEKGPHIGVSINAGILTREGEAEGKKGRIAEKFVFAYSTDFVTKAGAGGAPIVPVTESDTRPVPQTQQEAGMTEQELAALKKENEDRKKENEELTKKLNEAAATAKAKEAAENHVVAVATVGRVLKEAGIEFKQSLLERVCHDPVFKEGKLDQAWINGVISDIVGESEVAKVTGLGTRRTEPDTKTQEADDKAYRENLQYLGVPEAGLDYALGVKE